MNQLLRAQSWLQRTRRRRPRTYTFPDLSGHNTSKPPWTPSSCKAGGARSTSAKPVDHGPFVNKIVEGLRGDAFALARDVGLDQLPAPVGLEHLITQIKAHVSPRAQEEAKELFRAGQRTGGPLARQSVELMLSYTQLRRRWWKTLIELDPSMQLSDSLRMELMFELSRLSRQEGLVVRACATSKDFEGVAEVLVEQYGRIHLREGSRSWTACACIYVAWKVEWKGARKGEVYIFF